MQLAKVLPFTAAAESDEASAAVGVDRILKAIRSHLGVDIAFVSRIADGEVVIRNLDSVPGAPVAVGQAFPAEDGYCQRIIDGRIPYLIPDTSQVAEVAGLACTAELPVGSHISVPIRLRDGSVYGTFCCFGFSPDPSLNRRDLDALRAFAELAAAHIQSELDGDVARREIEGRVAEVVERDNLTILYQPVYRLSDRRVVGVEALARFPDAASRPPDAWFSEADGVGLGVQLELAAVRAALRGLPYIPADVRLGVNVSPKTILSAELARLVESVPSGRLVLEITEHAVVRDYVDLKRALGPLRRHCAVAIDDAGAGYSGLRHIVDIAPDLIKLDMSLTRGIDGDPARAALATALVAFGREIGSRIVAEGVETGAELATLERLGVGSGQGYFLQKPMPIAAAQFLFRRSLSPAD
ncbi:MAG TPA: EAL domain-containing protein [Allosphingosinicella sp.]|nr:EAL domain-containing protein [Allosphingosinicella sp.]